MSQQARVPQFGKWDQAGDDGQFTQYFDNARRGRNAGTLYNPNDPSADPEAFSEDSPSAHAPTSRPTNEHHRNVIQQKPFTGSVQQRSSDRVNPSDAQSRNSGRDRSFEQSPLQNQVPPRMKSPMDKRVPPSEGHANGLKYQRKPGARPGPDETPERAATVPQFGEWDKNEEFTDIFNRVKEEKKTGVVSPMHTKQNYSTQRKKDKDRDFAKICCFSWFMK